MKRNTTRRTYRGPAKYRPGEIVRRHQPSRIPAKSSPLAADLARIREDLREASAQGRRVAISHREAVANADRAREDFLRACDADRYAPEVVSLEVKFREADRELHLREKELAACHSRLNRIEGEVLSHERFST
jgi:hypothetical protein